MKSEEGRKSLGPWCTFEAAWGEVVPVRTGTAIYLGPVQGNWRSWSVTAAFSLRRLRRVLSFVHERLDALEGVEAK